MGGKFRVNREITIPAPTQYPKNIPLITLSSTYYKYNFFCQFCHLSSMVDEKLTNAYISVEVDDTALERLYNAVSEALNILEVPHEKSPRPHVSIAYTLGEKTIKELEAIVEEIAEAPFLIESLGIAIIPGNALPKDFISLKIKDNDDFLYAQEFVAENCEIQTIFNGNHFIAHISLFTIDQGLFESIYEDLAQVLEVYISSITPIKLRGRSISVFNKDRELIIQKKI